MIKVLGMCIILGLSGCMASHVNVALPKTPEEPIIVSAWYFRVGPQKVNGFSLTREGVTFEGSDGGEKVVEALLEGIKLGSFLK